MGTAAKENTPEPLVFEVRTSPDAVLFNIIFAPGMTAPVLSATVPPSEAVVPCAKAAGVIRNTAEGTSKQELSSPVRKKLICSWRRLLRRCFIPNASRVTYESPTLASTASIVGRPRLSGHDFFQQPKLSSVHRRGTNIWSLREGTTALGDLLCPNVFLPSPMYDCQTGRSSDFRLVKRFSFGARVASGPCLTRSPARSKTGFFAPAEPVSLVAGQAVVNA